MILPEVTFKYECEKCGAVITSKEKPIVCNCGSKNLKHLITLCEELTEEQKNEIKMVLGMCYENILKVIDYYIDLPKDKAKLLAIWIIGSHFQQEFESFPLLFLNAMRGSGKTRTLKLISSLAKGGDGKVINNITEAVMFRHPKGTIMCIDELESIGNKEKSTLRELFNAAYKKGMAVQRMKKVKIGGEEKQIIETFEPYFPIAMANIWGLGSEVLEDRTITIILEKSNNQAITKIIEDFNTNPAIHSIKRTLDGLVSFSVVILPKRSIGVNWNLWVKLRYSYTNTHTTPTTLPTLTTLEPLDLEEEKMFLKIDNANIDGRNFELFFPLLLISKMIGEEVFLELLEIATKMVGEKKEEEYMESKDVQLYQFVSEHGKEKEFIALKEFTSHFRLYSGDTEKDETWVNERWVGKALRRLDLIREKRRMASGRFFVLDKVKAKEKLQMFKSREVNRDETKPKDTFE